MCVCVCVPVTIEDMHYKGQLDEVLPLNPGGWSGACVVVSMLDHCVALLVRDLG